MNKRLSSRLLAVAAAFVGSATLATTAEAASFTRYHLGGGWYFKVFVPTGYDGSSAVPLVTMLHGCTQNADDFAAGTRMNAIAENNGFIVVYPEMNKTYNAYDCWNWFYDYNQHRNAGGEADIIDNAVDWVLSNYRISSKRYTAGMSAGGYMTSIIGAAYPENARVIGIHSGGMYNAADSATEANYTMKYGSAYSPNSAGYDAALEMNYSNQLRRIPAIVFHGAKDGTVNPKNAWQAKDQWAQTNDYAGTYTDPNGPKASNIMWNYFKAKY
jgi:poly(hydroxyalkanoate) depolymerase family esterase